MIILRYTNYSIINGVVFVQKEFGIRSGLKKLGKSIKDKANNVWNWKSNLNKSIENDRNAVIRLSEELPNIKKFKDSKIEKKLRKIAEKDLDSGILETDRLGNVSQMLSSKDAKELDLPERLWNNNADSDTINKASNLMNSKKYVIIHPKESSTDLLAHEMGHIISDSGKAGRFRKWVSHRKANSLDGRGEFLENIFDDKTKNPLKSIKRIIRSGFINSDERAATKNALKLLKDNGATQEQIKEASDFLKKAGDTYKIGSKSYIKSPINNFVNRKKKR